MKATVVRTVTERMKELDGEMTLVWQKIIMQRQKVSDAISQTLPLENLSTLIYGKFFKHIQTQIKAIADGPAYVPKSKQVQADRSFIDEEDSKEQQANRGKSEPKGEQSTAKRTNLIDNMIKTNVLRETLRASAASAANLSHSQRAVESDIDLSSAHAELYMLKQDTNALLVLDFEKKLFEKQTISQKIPTQSKSLQTPNGDIFLVGGLSRSK